MTPPEPHDCPLDPVWVERFEADRREDERREHRLLVNAMLMAVLVGVLSVARWSLLRSS